MTKPRLRQLGIAIGRLPPGPGNAITDVPDVWVGHTTLIGDTPRIARTGVTVIVPRAGEILDDHAFAGFFSLNGFGEMTGTLAIDEFGLLTSPIALTNTNQVGVVHEALVAYAAERFGRGYKLPVVTETHDGWLNDANAFHVKREHVYQALEAANSGPVAEGNVGGGTGMICHEFKGGIGTASRVVSAAGSSYTLGVLVQANYGDRRLAASRRGAGRPRARNRSDSLALGRAPLGRLDHRHYGHRCAAARGAMQAPGEARRHRSGACRRFGTRQQRRPVPGVRHRESLPG